MVTDIRGYHANDLVVCRGLWHELTEHHQEIYDDSSIGGETPGHLFDEHLANVGVDRVWVAEKKGKIVGMVSLQDSEGGLEIEPIIVKKGHRGEGIGEKLLRFAIQKARELGVRYLMIRPVMRNWDAIRKFHREGFVNIGRIELFKDLRGMNGKKDHLCLEFNSGIDAVSPVVWRPNFRKGSLPVI
ncbi:MAG: GNAT family N-acetyltransferase [Candidatus Thorarchaeota archaeon]|nr:GNAT family N-acetyltransferase [Candidatus Thorarchaeota archaeon]